MTRDEVIAAIEHADQLAADALEKLPTFSMSDRREVRILAEGLKELAAAAAALHRIPRVQEAEEKLCLGCGAPFTPANDQQKTCSDRCRKRLSRIKQGKPFNLGHFRGRPSSGENL